MYTQELERIDLEWQKALKEFFSQVNLRPQEILVLGCSTSEVLGQDIGKGGSLKVAEVLLPPLLEETNKRGIYLAVQCCEHLNRALVVEEACARYYRLDEVTVLPSSSAGGSMAFKYWQELTSPIMVECIQSHAGIDIGDTFIGMHLRPVAVPIRVSIKEIGKAHLTMARTRPRLIGGPRALYP